jgi:hypothetical protein
MKKRKMFRNLTALFIVLIIIAAIPLQGYLYSTYKLKRYEKLFGVYPSLEEAIDSTGATSDHEIQGRVSPALDSQPPNGAGNPYIWYVYTLADTQRFANGNSLAADGSQSGVFYVHVKDGWVQYPQDAWISIGGLEFWMGVYHLYGE